MSYRLRQRAVLATAIAVLFHLIGLVGTIMQGQEFVRLTALNLWLMFGLLLWSQPQSSPRYFQMVFVVFFSGLIAEWIGVHYGWLFGSYHYGQTLGIKIADIPVTMGCNWVTVVAGATCIAKKWLDKKRLHWAALATIAATLATLFDFLMEPVAIRYDYWQWHTDNVPLFNYFTWFCLAFVLAALWLKANIPSNQFSINLFVIQFVFFLILRIVS